MGKLNHSKLNMLRKSQKSSQDARTKSKKKLRIKKDLATDAQKKYMCALGIKFTPETSLREAIELIRSRKKELEKN